MFSFIENYGTHIIISVTVGGKDEVYIKQHSSSQLSELEFRNYVKEIGSERFSDVDNKLNATPINYSEKVSSLLILLCKLKQGFWGDGPPADNSRRLS